MDSKYIVLLVCLSIYAYIVYLDFKSDKRSKNHQRLNDDYVSLLNEAKLAYHQKDSETAILILNNIENPNILYNKEVFFELKGLCYNDISDFDNAIFSFGQALKIKNDSFTLYNRSLSYSGIGDIESQVRDLKESLRQLNSNNDSKILNEYFLNNQLRAAEMKLKHFGNHPTSKLITKPK